MKLEKFSKKLQFYMAPVAILGIPLSCFTIIIGVDSWFTYVGLFCYFVILQGAWKYYKDLTQ